MNRVMDQSVMRHSVLRAALAVALMVCLWVSPSAAVALDTSAGFGLQDRALFQETVDYTLTNQTVSYTHLTLPTKA